MDLTIIIRIVSIRKSFAKPLATRVRSKQIIPLQTSGVLIIKNRAMIKYGIIILSHIFRKEKGKNIKGIIEAIKYNRLSCSGHETPRDQKESHEPSFIHKPNVSG
jgi:hypothetical protein